MDPRLLRYYNQELAHLHEMGAEFARQFPKIAARLGMDGIAVADPYVERLMEGVGFLAARVQLKIDAEFPRFTQHLLSIIYPDYLAPTPAMIVARFLPELNEAGLAHGFTIPRGSALRSALGKGDLTACEFRSAHDVTLWPIELVEAAYFSLAPDLPLAALPGAQLIKGGIRLRLKCTAGLGFNDLDLDTLRVYFAGSDEVAYQLHELALGTCAGVLAAPSTRPWPWYEFLDATHVRSAGFSDEEALLPVTLRGFQGYRLLHEYFAFPQRFLFADIGGLGPAIKRHTGEEFEIVLLFKRSAPALENVVDVENFALFCTPAINLFPKRADRIHLGDDSFEYHAVPDRTRPMDFEVYEVNSVVGYGSGNTSEQPFLPFYAAYHAEAPEHQGYFMVRREPRLLSVGQQRTGARSSYIGSEVYLSLVDPEEAPYSSDLRQLSINTLCTNRDLPLQMPVGAGRSDLSLDSAAPVVAIRAIRGPSKPRAPLADGATAWRLISHLSLNYLSLVNSSAEEGAAALRELLDLYAAGSDAGARKQIEGVVSVDVQPTVRRLPSPGLIAFGRGLRIMLEVDDLHFQGSSPFLFGAVMEQFFARHASINSFTETVLRSPGRGEIMRWVPRCGERPIL
jgi:type VI secretion system protein ImpG